MQYWHVVTALLAASSLAVPALAQEDARRLPGAGGRHLALAVGNDSYTKAPLTNAANDARTVQRTLAELGWDTALVTNGTRQQVEQAVAAFAGKIGPGDEAVFFYAGHGIQVEGLNYLIPVDFDAQDETDAKYRAVSAEWVLEKMSRAGARLSVMILDACRDNPFRASRSAGGGLAQIQAAKGSLIAFATAPGSTAADNPRGANGLFTAQLVEALRKPGLTHDDVFNDVRERVVAASGGRQVPWVSSSVIGRFRFNLRAAPPAPAGAEPAAGVPGALELGDLEAGSKWEAYERRMAADFARVKEFEARADLSAAAKREAWERFLSQYAADDPNSSQDERLRSESQARVQHWQAQPPPVTPATPSAPGSNPREIYSQAYADYSREKFDLAIQEFKGFQQQYPDSEFTDNAQYWIGECYYAKKDYGKAVDAWDTLFQGFPASDKLPDARLKKGMALESLGRRSEALVEYGYVVDRYPNTPAAKKAREKLK